MGEPPVGPEGISPEARAPIHIQFARREVVGYGVIETELAMLASSYSSKNQAFFGFTSGVAVTAAFALLTGSFPPHLFALIGATGFVALIMAIYFLNRMRDDDRRAQQILDTIRRTYQG